jgi:hypothetical protein
MFGDGVDGRQQFAHGRDQLLRQVLPQPHQLAQFLYRRLRQLAGRGTLLRAESGDLSTVNTVGFGPRQFLPGKPVRTQRID